MMSKEVAIARFLIICKMIYTQHRKLRTYLSAEDMDAFHLVYTRLDEVGREFAETELYLGLSFHPYYPVVKDRYSGRYYISHYQFHKWIESYLNVLRRIEPLRAIVAMHDNETDYRRSIQEAWGKFTEPVTYEENQFYAEFCQLQWERLQAKQLSLFEDNNLT